MSQILLPNEPNYFVATHFDRLLLFCCEHKASDITFQTGEVVFAEIHGRQVKITQRPLTMQELSDIIKSTLIRWVTRLWDTRLHLAYVRGGRAIGLLRLKLSLASYRELCRFLGDQDHQHLPRHEIEFGT